MRAIGKQETSAGQEACTLRDRQECLPYLNACRYLCDFRRNATEGGEQGENRYILRNKANKSFRINSSSC